MDALKAIYSRVSTRDFEDILPTYDELNKIIGAGMTAPVGRCQYDTLHLTVVTDKQLLDDITVAADMTNRPRAPFYGAPALIVVSSLLSENPSIEYSNVGSIIENMAIAARATGLASVYLWAFATVLRANPELTARLNLPDGFVPISGLAVGTASTPLEEFDAPRHIITVNRV